MTDESTTTSAVVAAPEAAAASAVSGTAIGGAVIEPEPEPEPEPGQVAAVHEHKDNALRKRLEAAKLKSKSKATAAGGATSEAADTKSAAVSTVAAVTTAAKSAPAPPSEAGSGQQRFWMEELAAIDALVTAEYAANPKQENNNKRKLYSQLELLRLDYSEQPTTAHHLHALEHETDTQKLAALKTSELGVVTHEHLKQFDAVRKKMVIPHSRPDLGRTLIKLVLAIAYVLVAVPVLFVLLPLRLLHPLLREYCGITNNYLPIDMCQKYFARSVLAIAGVDVYFDGLENVQGKPSVPCSNGTITANTLGMFTHASNWDPFIVSAGPVAFKWIGKTSVFMVPLIGWLAYGWGHIPIDRSNRTRAIQSLNDAVSRIHKWGRSIAIAPEGTRSKTGRLMDFKKGPFHIAVQCGLPVTPVLSFGAYESWAPGVVFGGDAQVVVRYLPKIAVKSDDTPHSLMVRVRRAVLLGLAEPLNADPTSYPRYYDPRIALAFIPVMYVLLWSHVLGPMFRFIF